MTPNPAASSPARRRRRSVLYGLLVLALALAGALAWLLRGPLPAYAGRVHLAGLEGPVEIVRDRNAIPHIRARSMRDAYFALGYVHAQDRLWQMEMNRRIAAGRVAEAVGPGALPTDRFLRTLGVRRAAQASLEHLDADARAVLDAYAAGVNAWISGHPGPLPLEFLATGVRPEPWQPADSIGWVKMMAWDLAGNWTEELLRLRLSTRLDTRQLQEFLPPYPGDAPLPVTDFAALYRSLGAQALALGPTPLPHTPEGIGSNNWVVAGSRSASGKPLLANDPHLGLTVPSVWYLAHLEAPGLRVIGGTLPGVPLVIVGRTERIAWGMTNTKPDTQDLYLERLDPARPGYYQAPDGPRPFVERREVLHVKGAADEELVVRETRHGPVLPAGGSTAGLSPEYVLAMRWTALDPDDLTYQAGLRMPLARNWDAFVATLRGYHTPQQNIVYADVDGHIGFIAPGRVPLRRPDNDLMGLAPAPGWDARYDWTGYVPFEDLPQRLDPPGGEIHTANDKIVDPAYPYYITAEWAPPYRSRRIGELLAARPRHTLDDFARMHADVLSLHARELLPRLRYTVTRDALSTAALERLNRWDGTMDAERPEPLIYAAWMRALGRRLYADELGPLFTQAWDIRGVFTANVLADRDGQARWCDDITTPAVEDCDFQLSAALADAVAELARQYGPQPAAWRWADAHVARAEHRPFSRVPLLADWFELNVPVGGDVHTVNVARHHVADAAHPYRSTQGASLRMLIDLADPDAARFIQATGQSGQRPSPHYADFLGAWRRVEYLPMSMRAADYEAGALGTLRLLPAR